VRPITFAVKNTGDEPLTGLGAAISGADWATFVVSHALPDSLAPGAMARLAVSFAPNVKGNMAAMLTISSNDADESAFTISLLATSQVTGPVLRIREVGVGEVRRISSFGVVTSPVPAASEVASNATLVLTNDGDAVLVNLQAVPFSGAFSVSASLPSTTLAPGASMVVQVSNGSSSQERLSFQSNDGAVRFDLALKPGLILIGGPGTGVIISPGPGVVVGSGPIIMPINTSIGDLQVNIVNPPVLVLPNPNASGPVNFAFSWRLGDSDVGAQAGGALTVTKLDPFAANGTITVNVPQTVTGSPTYVDTAGTPAATIVQSKLGAHFDGTGKITSGLTLGLPGQFRRGSLGTSADDDRHAGSGLLRHLGHEWLRHLSGRWRAAWAARRRWGCGRGELHGGRVGACGSGAEGGRGDVLREWSSRWNHCQCAFRGRDWRGHHRWRHTGGHGPIHGRSG